MPGIVAFVGAEAADTRRALDRLKRRPWHAVQLLEDRSARAVVGVVGENGGVAADPATGVLVAVDGEFVESGRTQRGAEVADELLRLYLRDGTDCDPPDGWFGAAIWDPRAPRLVLLTDPLEGRPIYTATLGSRILAAGELKALLAAGVEPRLDHQAAAELLAYEFLLGEHTLLEGVRAIPPASTISIEPGGREQARRRWRYRLEPAPDGDEGELVEEFSRLLTNAVHSRLDENTALALSGGLDSRSIAATLRTSEARPTAASYGAAATEDMTLAAEVAYRAGLPHVTLELARGYLARGAAETVFLSEGRIRCLHSHHLALRVLRGLDVRSVLIGYGGDAIVRGRAVPPPEDGPLADVLHRSVASCVSDDLAAEVLSPSFARRLSGRARESFAERIAEEEGDRAAIFRQFMWNQTHRAKVLPGALLFADDLTPRDPFADATLIEFCRRMPERLRIDGVLERAYLSRFDELATIRSPKDGLPPHLTGWRRELGRQTVKLRSHTRKAVARRIGAAARPSRLGIGDYGADLRTASAPLLALLLEPRTLARGQLREDGVRRLVTELLNGRRQDTRPLGTLLTLELFQRQFIDGETPPEIERPAAAHGRARVRRVEPRLRARSGASAEPRAT